MRVLVPIHGEGPLGEMPVDMSVQCATCQHKGANLSCDAYEVIPDAILFGKHNHRKPFPGDNGIRFEPIGKP